MKKYTSIVMFIGLISVSWQTFAQVKIEPLKQLSDTKIFQQQEEDRRKRQEEQRMQQLLQQQEQLRQQQEQLRQQQQQMQIQQRR